MIHVMNCLLFEWLHCTMSVDYRDLIGNDVRAPHKCMGQLIKNLTEYLEPNMLTLHKVCL